MFTTFFRLAVCSLLLALPVLAQGWPAPVAPAVPQADGYVVIPHAAIAPDPNFDYRALFDATKMPSKPDAIVPALNAAGGQLNDLVAGKVPRGRQHFTVVFHGPAVDGILDDAHYKQKYGIPNPNLPVLAEMKKRGVELFVCGQHLAAEKIDPKTLSTLVTVAADAYLVLITYQQRGYGAMWF